MPARNGIDQADESSKAPATMNNNTEQPHSEDRIKMSEKPEQTTTTRPQPQSGRPGSTSPTGSRTATGGMTPPGKVLTGKLQQFIIAARRLGGMMMPPLGLQPVAFDYVEQALRNSPDVEVVDRVGPKGLVGTLTDGMAGVPHFVVARMAVDKAEILMQQSAGQLIVERDQPLHPESLRRARARPGYGHGRGRLPRYVGGDHGAREGQHAGGRRRGVSVRQRVAGQRHYG